jgi:hypothetical protein
MSRQDAMTMRQAKRLVRSYAQGEGRGKKAAKAPAPLETSGLILGRPLDPADEFGDALADAYQDKLLCYVCMGSTDYFYLIAGSSDFYMKQLVRLGVRPEEALRLTAWDKARHRDEEYARLGGMRRAPVCPVCATKAGMEKMPASYAEIRMRAHAGAGPEQPIPVPILGDSEEVIQNVLDKLRGMDMKRDQARRKQEEYEMRLKGAQKDVADFVEKLEKGKLDNIRALGYMPDISNGHIKIYHGEPGREVAKDGRFITTISQTPRNAERTVSNAQGLIARWERENLNTEPEEEATETRLTDAEKAGLIARYDYADEAGQRALLEKHGIRHQDIAGFREYLIGRNWKIPPWPVPLPDDLGRTQACDTCGKDEALTRENFAQEKVQGRYTWLKTCNGCKGTVKPPEAKPEPVRKPVVPSRPELGTIADAPLDDSEAKRMITLMGRKRDITSRLAVIDDEKARKVAELQEQMNRLTADLDAEKERLIAERSAVETELLELVSG